MSLFFRRNFHQHSNRAGPDFDSQDALPTLLKYATATSNTLSPRLVCHWFSPLIEFWNFTTGRVCNHFLNFSYRVCVNIFDVLKVHLLELHPLWTSLIASCLFLITLDCSNYTHKVSSWFCNHVLCKFRECRKSRSFITASSIFCLSIWNFATQTTGRAWVSMVEKFAWIL